MIACDKMQKERLHLKVTDRLHRTVDIVVASSRKYNTKKDFVEKSILNNYSYIMENLSGHKDLLYFIKFLNDDVMWIDIQNPDIKMNTKLMSDKPLSSQFAAEIPESADSILNKCSNIASTSKSDIVRICIIKELYNSSQGHISESNYKRISDKWLTIQVKLHKANKSLIDKLGYNINETTINTKLDEKVEYANIKAIADYYLKFKNTKGYEIMKETKSGSDTIHMLEKVLEAKE